APARRRGAQPVEEPRLLRRPQHRLRRRRPPRVGELGAAPADRRGRLAAAPGAAGIEDLDDVLRLEGGEALGREGIALWAVADRLGAERAVVGQDELDVRAEAEGAVELEAPDRRQVAGLEAEAVVVEAVDPRVAHGGGPEAVGAAVCLGRAGLLDAR